MARRKRTTGPLPPDKPEVEQPFTPKDMKEHHPGWVQLGAKDVDTGESPVYYKLLEGDKVFVAGDAFGSPNVEEGMVALTHDQLKAITRASKQRLGR